MNNNLSSLNDYLFEQLERLNDDEELKGENLDRELKRAKAISGIATGIIKNAKIILEAKQLADEWGVNTSNVLMLEDEKMDKRAN